MNGYPTDFGITECIKLCASNKFNDKRIAYLGMLILVDETDQVLMLMTNSLKQDLNGADPQMISLALTVMADIASAEMMRELMPDIETHLRSPNPLIRKKAAIAAVRATRKLSQEETINILQLTAGIFDIPSTAVHIAGTALVRALCEQSASNVSHLRATALDPLFSILSDHVSDNRAPGRPADLYGSRQDIGNPFLLAKLIACLRHLLTAPCEPHAPPSDASLYGLSDLLSQLLRKFDAKKTIHCAILYECVRTVPVLSRDDELLELAVTTLGTFLNHKEATVRYVALQQLDALANAMGGTCLSALSNLEERLRSALRDADPTLNRQAMHLLFRTAGSHNIEDVIEELMKFVGGGGEGDAVVDGVRKIFVLADAYGPSDEWKVATFVKALALADRHVPPRLATAFVAFVSERATAQPEAVRLLYTESLSAYAKQRGAAGGGGAEGDLLGDMPVSNAAHDAAPEEARGDVAVRPRVESVAVHVLGEHGSGGVAVSDAMRALRALASREATGETGVSGRGDDEDERAVSRMAVSALAKLAARDGSGGGGGSAILDAGLAELAELGVGVEAPLEEQLGAPKLLMAAGATDGAHGTGLEMVALGDGPKLEDDPLAALTELAGVPSSRAVVPASQEVVLFEGGEGAAGGVGQARSALEGLRVAADVEVQQRACEYAALLQAGMEGALRHVGAPLPRMRFGGMAEVVEEAEAEEAASSTSQRVRQVPSSVGGTGMLLDLLEDGGNDNAGAKESGAPLAITQGRDEAMMTLDDLVNMGGAAGGNGNVDDILAITMGESGQVAGGAASGLEDLDTPAGPSSGDASFGGGGNGGVISEEGVGGEESVGAGPAPAGGDAEAVLSATLFESEYVRLEARFFKDEVDKPERTRAEMRMENCFAGGDVRLSQCVLQLAVPKYMQLDMLPASGSEMSASGDDIGQTVVLENSMYGKKGVQMRFRIEFLVEGETEVRRLQGVASSLDGV